MTKPTRSKGITRLAALLLCLALIIPGFARGEDARKTVRVGWYETPFNTTDAFGRRSGYAYEYQRKIAAYTGWRYEYVEGGWLELLQMLRRGEIDLMSDVSYVEERARDMLYASLPMGTETYYVFVTPDCADIVPEDPASLNGKRVGVTHTSVQHGLFVRWAQTHGVEAEVVETTCPEKEAMQMLADGQLDAVVTLDAYGSPESAAPVFKVGSSDFYFAVNKARPDLLAELDAAMNRIQDENRYYNQQLYEKYLKSAGDNLYLNVEEKRWLEAHGTIRVGYQDNYLAFCAKDPDTGELTGALRDYLDYAATGMQNAALRFEPVAYPTASAAMEALQRGEVDCMFPANLSDYDGEKLGLVMTPPLMRTEMDAVVRAAEQKEFVLKGQITVAVNAGNPNYDMFLVDNFPGWQTAHYTDTPACLRAVAGGEADCIIVSNYRFSNISKLCENLRLATVYSGVDLDYCFAVREGSTALYSLLTRVVGMVPAAAVNAALTYYSTEDARTSFFGLLKENLASVLGVVTVMLLVFVVLLLRSIQAEKHASKEHLMVNDLNRRVFVDALTSVRNKGAFSNYLQELQSRIDCGEQPAFAIGVFDCDDLKTINDRYGHEKGDEYLKAASRVICRVFQHSPVFRIGGDEFAVVLQNEDFRCREQLVEAFENACVEARAAAGSEWEQVRVALGVAVFDSHLDSTVFDTFNRADQTMYDHKRAGKQER